jgi:general secretion pathway protein A
MFEEFYKFRENPFQLIPNPDFLYKSENHQKALTYLEYGLMENVGIIVLTGEVGSGKTTTAQYILKNLGDGFDTAMITNTNITPLQMLRMIQSEFDIVSGETDKVTVIESLNRHFIAQYEAGKRTLLVIDEAQNISSQALEEVRMLSNLQSDQNALLQIILIGQPELLQTLKKHEMRQVTQRVAVHFHLTALDDQETADYIAYRVKKAGGREDLFTPAAAQLVYALSGGIPRLINLICQASLVYGFADEEDIITQDIIREITQDRLGVGIESGPEPVLEVEPAPAACSDSEELSEAVDNIRMEIKGRIQQLESDMATQNDNLLKQVENLFVEERRQTEDFEQRLVKLEKKLSALSQLFEQLAKRQNDPSVVLTPKSIKNPGA